MKKKVPVIDIYESAYGVKFGKCSNCLASVNSDDNKFCGCCGKKLDYDKDILEMLIGKKKLLCDGIR